MNVTHDLIAAVQGPGWKYGLSRILIDEDKNGVVFIAGSEEPFATFTVDVLSTSRGTGTSADGEIAWRRRGSSCQYKLAKCKVSTQTITGWWESSLTSQPEQEMLAFDADADADASEQKTEEEAPKPKRRRKKAEPKVEAEAEPKVEAEAEPKVEEPKADDPEDIL